MELLLICVELCLCILQRIMNGLTANSELISNFRKRKVLIMIELCTSPLAFRQKSAVIVKENAVPCGLIDHNNLLRLSCQALLLVTTMHHSMPPTTCQVFLLVNASIFEAVPAYLHIPPHTYTIRFILHA